MERPLRGAVYDDASPPKHERAGGENAKKCHNDAPRRNGRDGRRLAVDDGIGDLIVLEEVQADDGVERQRAVEDDLNRLRVAVVQAAVRPNERGRGASNRRATQRVRPTR